jgi:phosphotriesterase-related protein
MTEIQTVTGATRPEKLGRTLMHEHLVIGYPGWSSDSVRPGPTRDEMFARCVDRIEEMKDLGVTAMLDPCPNDLGRDVEFMAEVAQRTRFQIICSTGLYKEEEGGTSYWKFRGAFGGGQADAMAELFEKEITEGIGSTGIRAGIIKVGTGHQTLTEYETWIFEAAARAAVETGAPITTHTDDGRFGDDQQDFLVARGVPAHRIIIGHSCGTSDHDYHMRIARNGSYLGFDRFGLDILRPDEERRHCFALGSAPRWSSPTTRCGAGGAHRCPRPRSRPSWRRSGIRPTSSPGSRQDCASRESARRRSRRCWWTIPAASSPESRCPADGMARGRATAPHRSGLGRLPEVPSASHGCGLLQG